MQITEAPLTGASFIWEGDGPEVNGWIREKNFSISSTLGGAPLLAQRKPRVKVLYLATRKKDVDCQTGQAYGARSV